MGIVVCTSRPYVEQQKIPLRHRSCHPRIQRQSGLPRKPGIPKAPDDGTHKRPIHVTSLARVRHTTQGMVAVVEAGVLCVPGGAATSDNKPMQLVRRTV